jgi:hypothetical protein
MRLDHFLERHFMRIASFCVVFTVACTPEIAGLTDAGASTPDAGASTADAGDGRVSDAGASFTTDAGSTVLPALISTDLTVGGAVVASASSTIAAGAKLTILAGTTVIFAPNAALTVQGTLLVQGTKANWAVFDAPSGVWGGLTVRSGGSATLSHLQVHRATVAFSAEASSTWAISGFQVDSSQAAMQLASTGTVSYATIHMVGASQRSSPISISSGSPAISDMLIDNANLGVDMIIVNGGSPTFDHVEVTKCHCAYHFNGGSNIEVKNGSIHDNAYVLMNFSASNTRFSTNNFVTNSVNIGDCSQGGSFTGTGNYATSAMFDSSCASQTNASPAASAVAGVGPRAEP